MSSYKVRIWSILTNTRSKKPTYTVRWLVADEPFRETFATKAAAESFRSKLLVAQREGVAFDEELGLPEPMARELRKKDQISWYQHAIGYVDMKWTRSSARERKSVADALATVTPALLINEPGTPSPELTRAALYGWAFNKARRRTQDPPEHLAEVVDWLQAHTVALEQLMNPVTIRAALDALTVKGDGTAAASNTISRKRAVFYAALNYGVELGHLPRHPMSLITWRTPKSTAQVDRRVVANPEQARRLLAAVAVIADDLTAYYGSMYYAGLRPEEAAHLHDHEYEPPPTKGEWGWLHLTGATVETGIGWADDHAKATEDRELKHRAKTATRDVPVCPDLAELLDRHLATYGVGPNGKLFVTRRGPGGKLIAPTANPIPSSTRSKVWKEARRLALAPAEYRSPVAKRPYDLRHACLSLWLNAGVAPTQVAEWAGQSLKVLLDVYAKCLYGGIKIALKRITAALKAWSDDQPSTGDNPG